MKKNVIAVLAGLMSVACLFAGIALSNVEAKAVTVAYVTEMFTKSSGINMEVATDSNGNNGVAFQAFKKDAFVVLNNETAGEYNFAFGSENLGTKSFSLVFEGEEGEFAINVQAPGSQLNVSVELDGKKGGLNYKNNLISGATHEGNVAGRFTQIAKSENTYIRFNPLSMCVYVGNGTTELLVWNMAKSVNDSHSLGATRFPFNSYSVKLCMESGSGEEKLFVYSIGEDALNGEVLVDKGAPSVYAPAYTNMKTGEEYTLPLPYAYDLFDGEIEDISVAVKYRRKTVIAKQKYEDGMTIFPKDGEYTITYYAKDAAGNEGEYTVTLSSFSMPVEEKFNFSYMPETKEVGVGSSIALPNAYYTSNYALIQTPCLLTVSVNGEALEGYNDILLYDQVIRFNTAGTYTVTLRPIDNNTSAYYEYNIIATEELPKIEYACYDFSLGDILETENQSVTFKGKDYTYETIVYYPDGKAYIGDLFTLDQSGKYTVEYRFVDESNNLYKYKASFSISDILYEFESNESYAHIGANQYNDEVGLNVYMAYGDKFTYSKVIDVSDNTKEEPLIEILATPINVGVQELKQFQIILTDVYNENNYVTIDVVDYQNTTQAAYAKVAHAGQILSGYEGSTFHKDIWGTYFRTSLYGVESCIDYPIRIYLDYAEKQMYVGNGEGSLLIADLDDYNCYDELWEGFTTGEVKLTIEGVSWQSSLAGLFIKSVDGETFESEAYDDVVAPKINVDLEGYEEINLPEGLVGHTYPIFKATALDTYVGETKVYTNVYYDYGGDLQSQVSVVNGKFAINVAGHYTIVYTSYDNFGNQAVKTLKIKATESSDPIIIESIQEETVVVGKEYILPKVLASGGNGKLTIQCFIEEGGKDVLIEESYVFDTAGVYSLKFVATDYIGVSTEYEFSVIASYSDTPIFEELPIYPALLISGKEYSVQKAYAKYYAEDAVGEDCTIRIYLEDKNGRKEITGDTFVPQIDAVSADIKLIYEAAYGTAQDSYIYTIPTVQVNEGTTYYANRYFSVTGGSVSATNEGVAVSVSSNENSVEYINSLIADGFTLTFNINPEKSSVGALSLYLFDAQNRKNAVIVKITNTKGSTSSISINGGANGETYGSFVGTSQYDFSLTYDNDTFTISDAGRYSKTIETNILGERFNGFASGLVGFRFVFEDVTDETELLIKRLNNHNVSDITNDMVEPQAILKDGAYVKMAKIGDIISIKELIYGDVMSLNTTATYSVLCNKKVVTSIDGVELKNISAEKLYAFKCEEYGTYSIMYTVKDDSGNMYPYSHTVTVLDDISPEITVDGNISSAYKLNTNLTLPMASATDNVDGEVEPFVVVYAPSGMRTAYELGTTVSFSEVGKYTIKYIVYDSVGNIAEKVFIVTVE